MAYERLTGIQDKLIKMRPWGPLLASVIATIMLTPSGVFFRAQSVGQAFSIVGTMFNFSGWEPKQVLWSYPFEVAAVAFIQLRNLWFRLPIPEWVHKNRRKMRLYTEPLELAILLTLAIFLRGAGHGFVYFAF